MFGFEDSVVRATSGPEWRKDDQLGDDGDLPTDIKKIIINKEKSGIWR